MVRRHTTRARARVRTHVCTGDEELDDEHNPNELNFSEFLEAIGALIFFKDPNPYVPLIKKIDNFMQRYVALCVRRLPSGKPKSDASTIESGRRVSVSRKAVAGET